MATAVKKFELHQHQKDAVAAMLDVCENGGTLLIKGKAGTGKSSVVYEGLPDCHRIAAERQCKIISCAFTNKAVNRMKELGFPKRYAMTAHRLLYNTSVFIEVFNHEHGKLVSIANEHAKILSRGASTVADKWYVNDLIRECLGIPHEGEGDYSGSVEHANWFYNCMLAGTTESRTFTDLRKDYDPNDIIIVDEVGMMPLEILGDIMARYDTVIMMGDHRQLPPVSGQDTINVVEVDHCVELTKVHRSGDEILTWADIAEQDMLGPQPPLRLSEHPEFGDDDHQVLVYSNAEVFNVCNSLRMYRGIAGKPRQGEPLISMSEAKLMRKEQKDKVVIEEIEAELKHEGTEPHWSSKEPVPGHPDKILLTYTRKLSKNEMFKASGQKFHYQDKLYIGVELPDSELDWYLHTADFWNWDLQTFNMKRRVNSVDAFFAYAITAHRSQGSEFDHVVVAIRDKTREQFGARAEQDAKDRPRWNYTAITRAKKTVKICGNFIY